MMALPSLSDDEKRRIISLVERSRGLWDITDIKINIEDKYLAVLFYHRYEAYTHDYRIYVRLWPWDRWSGMTLEEKIKIEYEILFEKLQSFNRETIKKREVAALLEYQLSRL